MNHKRKRTYPSVAGIVMCILFIPIIVVNTILIVSTYTRPDEMPGVFGIKPAIVLSGSMEPVIKTGDLIFIHKTDTENLKEGDVICYLTSGKAVTHRISGITAGEDGTPRFITKGDANNTEDRLPVTAGQIEGIWKEGRIAGLGNIILFMQSSKGMIIFIICPLLLFIFGDIVRRWKLDRAENSRVAELEAELAELKAAGHDEKAEHSQGANNI